MRIKFLKFEYEVTDKEIDKMFKEYVKNGGTCKYDEYINALPTTLIKANIRELIKLFLINSICIFLPIGTVAYFLRIFLSLYPMNNYGIVFPVLDTVLIISLIVSLGWIVGTVLMGIFTLCSHIKISFVK